MLRRRCPLTGSSSRGCASTFLALSSILIVLMEAERARRELIALAHYGPLTGALPPRAGATGAGTRRPGLAPLEVDIDHFKQLDDRHGPFHRRRCSGLFCSAARSVLQIIFCRGAIAVAERLRAPLRGKFPPWCSRPANAEDLRSRLQRPDFYFKQLLSRADTVLYVSKRQSRDRIEASPTQE